MSSNRTALYRAALFLCYFCEPGRGVVDQNPDPPSSSKSQCSEKLPRPKPVQDSIRGRSSRVEKFTTAISEGVSRTKMCSAKASRQSWQRNAPMVSGQRSRRPPECPHGNSPVRVRKGGDAEFSQGHAAGDRHALGLFDLQAVRPVGVDGQREHLKGVDIDKPHIVLPPVVGENVVRPVPAQAAVRLFDGGDIGRMLIVRRVKIRRFLPAGGKQEQREQKRRNQPCSFSYWIPPARFITWIRPRLCRRRASSSTSRDPLDGWDT